MSSIHRLSVQGRRCVGIAGLLATADASAEIVTYALGSCLGITLYDPVTRVGGLVHVMLPASALDPAKAARQPGMFVDTGVPALLGECLALGARRERLLVHVAGGARTRTAAQDHFRVGERNILALGEALAAVGLRIRASEVGGENCARTMHLELATGAVTIRADGATRRLAA